MVPLFRSVMMVFLAVILIYILKFFIDGYRYFKTRTLLIMILTFIIFLIGAFVNIALSTIGHYQINILNMKVEGLYYHYLGITLYSIFEMIGFMTLIIFNLLIRGVRTKGLVIALPVLLGEELLGILLNVEMIINIVILGELIFLVANIASTGPSPASIGKYMVIIGFSLLIFSRVLMVFPLIPITEIFSTMMEVAGFSSLIVLRQDVGLVVKTSAKMGVSYEV
jgi:hypothetical protein